MVLEVGILATATILAAVIGAYLSWYMGKNKWKRIWLSGNIPMWVVNNAYQQWYPNKYGLPRKPLLIKGAYYRYKVISKDKNMIEPHARIKNMVVYRREPDGNK